MKWLLILAVIINYRMLTIAMLMIAAHKPTWQSWMAAGLCALLETVLGGVMKVAGDYARLRWVYDHFLAAPHYRLHRIPFSSSVVQAGLAPTFVTPRAFNRVAHVKGWLDTLLKSRGIQLDPVNVFYVEVGEDMSVPPAIKSFAGIISPSFVFVRDDPCRGAVPLFALFHELAHTSDDAW
ncbi:MAG: hypothetical protein JWN40_3368, partial [Phycisphaerales bacterium]|nr:hypothetical protein [Phycisphaerales bacterium]